MKEYGLIGSSLKNSFSENYFNSKFLSLALYDHSYQNFPVADLSELKEILILHPDLCGLNVTIPYKETIIPFLDELDESAAEAGAVNCIKIVRTRHSIGTDKTMKLTGYNTDVYGFENSLLPLIAHNKPKRALIFGTGGASKAVACVLLKQNISYLFVSRSKKPGMLTYQELDAEMMEAHQLLVNCTPSGMFPDIENAPSLPYQFVTSKHLAYDLIYLPIETLFLKQCREQGAVTKNGLEMLHLQAEKSWQIWKAWES